MRAIRRYDDRVLRANEIMPRSRYNFETFFRFCEKSARIVSASIDIDSIDRLVKLLRDVLSSPYKIREEFNYSAHSCELNC